MQPQSPETEVAPAKPAAPLLRDWIGAGMAAFAFAYVFFEASNTLVDPDLYGHVRFGQDVLRTGVVVQSDPYSYRTTGLPWINHEWLAEVIFAAIYDWGGGAGLVIFKTAFCLLLFGLGYVNFRRYGLSRLGASAIMLLAFLPAVIWGLPVRPQLFTYLLLLLELMALAEAERGHVRWLWAVPLLFVAWANLHGGLVAGLALLFLWAGMRPVLALGGYPCPGGKRTKGTIAAVLVLSVLAVFLNPYGADLVIFLRHAALEKRAEIGEWQPLSLTSKEGLAYLVLLGVVVGGYVAAEFLALWRTEDHPPQHGSLSLFVLCVAAGALPLMAQRHLALFSMAVLALAGAWLGTAEKRLKAAGKAAVEPVPGSRLMEGVIAGSLWVGAAAFALLSLPHFRGIHVEDFPARAVALLKASGIQGNLVVHFDWGEYVLWQLGPGIKVSVDGRRETVYPDELFQEDKDFCYGTGTEQGRDPDALLRAPGVDLVLVKREGFPVFERMRQKPDWALAYQDDLCGLFVRSSSAAQARLAAVTPPDVPFNGKGTYFP
jgi:hypothetical protein